LKNSFVSHNPCPCFLSFTAKTSQLFRRHGIKPGNILELTFEMLKLSKSKRTQFFFFILRSKLMSLPAKTYGNYCQCLLRLFSMPFDRSRLFSPCKYCLALINDTRQKSETVHSFLNLSIPKSDPLIMSTVSMLGLS